MRRVLQTRPVGRRPTVTSAFVAGLELREWLQGLEGTVVGADAALMRLAHMQARLEVLEVALHQLQQATTEGGSDG